MDFLQGEPAAEGVVIDPAYEFCAPQYFDFSKAQDEEAMQADSWFDRKTEPDEFSRKHSRPGVLSSQGSLALPSCFPKLLLELLCGD